MDAQILDAMGASEHPCYAKTASEDAMLGIDM